MVDDWPFPLQLPQRLVARGHAHAERSGDFGEHKLSTGVELATADRPRQDCTEGGTKECDEYPMATTYEGAWLSTQPNLLGDGMFCLIVAELGAPLSSGRAVPIGDTIIVRDGGQVIVGSKAQDAVPEVRVELWSGAPPFPPGEWEATGEVEVRVPELPAALRLLSPLGGAEPPETIELHELGVYTVLAHVVGRDESFARQDEFPTPEGFYKSGGRAHNVARPHHLR